MSFRILVLLAVITVTRGIPIPNGQIGRAEVECGEEAIDIVFLTEDVFNGRVFVVGHANESDCVSREVGRRTTSISVRKDRCGVVTIRSVCFFCYDPLFLTFKSSNSLKLILITEN